MNLKTVCIYKFVNRLVSSNKKPKNNVFLDQCVTANFNSGNGKNGIFYIGKIILTYKEVRMSR